MESLAARFPESGQIDLARLESACKAALAAVTAAADATEAIDGALEALHDGLGAAGVSAFVLEHGRLWSIGVRGYAMIPDGLPLEEGVIGRAVRSSETQLVVDTASDPNFVEVLRGVV